MTQSEGIFAVFCLFPFTMTIIGAYFIIKRPMKDEKDL